MTTSKSRFLDSTAPTSKANYHTHTFNRMSVIVDGAYDDCLVCHQPKQPEPERELPELKHSWMRDLPGFLVDCDCPRTAGRCEFTINQETQTVTMTWSHAGFRYSKSVLVKLGSGLDDACDQDLVLFRKGIWVERIPNSTSYLCGWAGPLCRIANFSVTSTSSLSQPKTTFVGGGDGSAINGKTLEPIHADQCDLETLLASGYQLA